jgi:hypothetical protein
MTKLEKAKYIAVAFTGGAKAQLRQEWTIGAAASIGLMQGLKYNGSFKRGIKGGAITLTVLMAANGVNNVVDCWDKIKAL